MSPARGPDSKAPNPESSNQGWAFGFFYGQVFEIGAPDHNCQQVGVIPTD